MLNENKFGIFKEKTPINKFRWVMFSILAAAFVSWIVWIIIDVFFVNEGISVELKPTPGTIIPISAEAVFNEVYENISRVSAIVAICLFSVSWLMEVSYSIIKARTIKSRRGVDIYEFVIHCVITVVLFGFLLKSIDMIRKGNWLLYIPTISSITDISGVKAALAFVELYHLDFLNYMTGAVSCVIASGIFLLLSDKKTISIQKAQQDLNWQMIVFAFLALIMVPCIIVPNVPEAGFPKGEIDWYNIFVHASGAILTQPQGVMLGVVMCFTFCKLVLNFLLPKEQIKAKTVVPNAIFFVLNTAFFITIHVFTLDLYKFITNELFVGICVAFTFVAVIALAPAIYGCVDIAKFAKHHKLNRNPSIC